MFQHESGTQDHGEIETMMKYTGGMEVLCYQQDLATKNRAWSGEYMVRVSSTDCCWILLPGLWRGLMGCSVYSCIQSNIILTQRLYADLAFTPVNIENKQG